MNYQPKAPFQVVGFKGGYMSWLAAIRIGKARYAAVFDVNGMMIWSPTESEIARSSRAAILNPPTDAELAARKNEL